MELRRAHEAGPLLLPDVGQGIELGAGGTGEAHLQGHVTCPYPGAGSEQALLDSLHTEEHVWAEFQLAARLVYPGGLILIHDANLAGGTVDLTFFLL